MPQEHYSNMAHRRINWRPFKQSSTLHIKEVKEVSLVPYDKRGRLYDPNTILEPSLQLPMLVWADVRLFSPVPAGSWWNHMEFGFVRNVYVFGWPGERLSSLPEHKYYFRDFIWPTLADRDFIFDELTKGMGIEAAY